MLPRHFSGGTQARFCVYVHSTARGWLCQGSPCREAQIFLLNNKTVIPSYSPGQRLGMQLTKRVYIVAFLSHHVIGDHTNEGTIISFRLSHHFVVDSLTYLTFVYKVESRLQEPHLIGCTFGPLRVCQTKVAQAHYAHNLLTSSSIGGGYTTQQGI